MTLAITSEHRALADTAAGILRRHQSVAAARALLEAPEDGLPAFWEELAGAGLLGLHIAEERGGSGFGLPEVLVVAEQLGRLLAPGPYVPTVIASAVLAMAAPPELASQVLPGLADGTMTGAVALRPGEVQAEGGKVSGDAGVVISGHLADLLLVPAGADVLVIAAADGGMRTEVPANLDPSRRAARVTLDGAVAAVLPGARQLLLDIGRAVLAAEAAGVAAEVTTMAAEYAKTRTQFGRPIGMFQAVKHHCANMLAEAELATAAVWDAGRASASRGADDNFANNSFANSDGGADGGAAGHGVAGAARDEFANNSFAKAGGGAGYGEQVRYTAAIAAVLAVPAAVSNASLNIQVHGGIGFTWEHDAHLYLRRAAAIAAVTDVERAAIEVTDLVRSGVRRPAAIDLPPEAEPVRAAVRPEIEQLRGLRGRELRRALIETGLAVPHWPRPWGRDASPLEQLVIEQELAAAGVKRPSYGITGWVILTLIQHASPEQVARWVQPALNQELIWCQLFSEPGAGSDAAGIRTRGVRADGGWRVSGQKVWTSGAHRASLGLATVRTDAEAAKHDGITTMVIDMHAAGVTVRPLRMPTGHSDFNEVFFDDVFVPDADVVGPVNGGWTVARATLGNESVSIGGGDGGLSLPVDALIAPLDAHPERLAGGAGRVGRAIARSQSMGVLNQRGAFRAVAGTGPGPEGNVTKLLTSEVAHEEAEILAELAGPDGAFTEGPGALAAMWVLLNRAMSIAGGTSEIKRNQIGERILGLPRDPLIS